MSEANDDHFEHLLAEWSDGAVVTPQRQAELESLLRLGPRYRRRFIEHCITEMALMEAAYFMAGPTPSESGQAPRRRLGKILRCRQALGKSTATLPVPAVAVAAAAA